MVNIFLILLFLLSIIYCCDLPLLFNLPFLICNKQSIMYDVAIGIISAFVFYLIEIVLPKLINRLKYKKLIINKLYNIRKDMIKTVEIISGIMNYSIDNKTIDIISEIEKNLNHINIFETRTKEYINGISLVVVDAIINMEDKIHNEIMEIIALNVLDKKTFDAILKIEKLKLRDYIRPLSLNKEGRIEGGHLIYNQKVINNDIVNIMKEYIKVLRSLYEFESKQYRKIF